MNNYYTLSGNAMPNYALREQSLKNIIDQANRELSALQNQQFPTNLTQNFQISPMQSGLPFKIVENIDDVNKELVISDTYFLSKDEKSFWIKDSKGNIRSFSINEIVTKNEKDLIIEDLQNQINELKRGMNNVNDKYDGANGYTKYDDTTSTNKSTNVQFGSASISKKHKSK